MSAPFISVVIPAYNGASFIREAIDSVFAQSFDDYDVLVVDDGSTDETRAIVESYGDRVRYHYQENQGLAVARNTGLRLAGGRYITYLDADDIWEPDNLRVKAAVLRAQPDLGGVFSEFSVFDEQGPQQGRGSHYVFPYFSRTGRDFATTFERRTTLDVPGGKPVELYFGHVFDRLFWGNFILPTSMVFSRQLALEVGEFRPDLRTQQDYEYWLRFSRRCPLAYVDRVLVRYRRHAAQLTNHRRIENILLAVHSIIDPYEAVFSGLGRGGEFNRRKAGLQAELARVYLGQGRQAEARQQALSSVRRDPRVLSSYVALAASLVPSPLLSWLRRHRPA